MSHSLQPLDYSPWNPSGQNTGVNSLSLLLVIPNPGIELGSPALQVDSLPAEPQGKPTIKLHWVRNWRILMGNLRACMLSWFYHVRLFATPWTVARQAPLSVGFSRQEYWSGLPCPPPGDLPDPGMEPESFMSPTLADRFFTAGAT